DLVAALAVENDLYAAFAGQRHHVPLRVDAERERRLVEVPDDLSELIDQPGWLDTPLPCFGAELLDDSVGVLALVIVWAIRKVDREGLDTLDVARSETNDGARVESAAEAHTQRDVAAQMDANRLVEAITDCR